jgi:MFS superfamily sulfate permease-like transporter
MALPPLQLQSSGWPQMLRKGGSLFFGAEEDMQQTLESIDKKYPAKEHVMLFSAAANVIELAGTEMLTKESEHRRKMGGGLDLVDVQPELRDMLAIGDQLHEPGEENMFKTKSDSTSTTYRRLDPDISQDGMARIFHEGKNELPSVEARIEQARTGEA